MTLIHEALSSEPSLPVIRLHAERLVLAKRRWRGVAEDGSEFGFVLEAPITHGTPFFSNETVVYSIEQKPEPVLEITLIPKPAAVARLDGRSEICTFRFK